MIKKISMILISSIILLNITGCSLIYKDTVVEKSLLSNDNDPIECSTSNFLPIVDEMWAITVVLSSINNPVTALTIAGVIGSSSYYGFYKTEECEKIKKK